MKAATKPWEKLYHVGPEDEGPDGAMDRDAVVAISEEDAATEFAEDNWAEMDYPESIEVIVRLVGGADWTRFKVTSELHRSYSAREVQG